MLLGCNIYVFRLQYIWSKPHRNACFCSKKSLCGAIWCVICGLCVAHSAWHCLYMAVAQHVAAAHAKLPDKRAAICLLDFTRVLGRYVCKYCHSRPCFREPHAGCHTLVRADKKIRGGAVSVCSPAPCIAVMHAVRSQRSCLESSDRLEEHNHCIAVGL